MPLGVHTGHRLAGRADVELAALADETFADGPPNWGTRVAVDRAFAAAGVERRVTLEINDTPTMVDFVRHGVAAAFLAPSFVRDPTGIALLPIRHHAPVVRDLHRCADDPSPRRRRHGAARAGEEPR